MKRLLTTIVMLVTLTGCQTLWQRIDMKNATYKSGRYAVELPMEWVRIETDKALIVTRDGISIQRLTIRHRPHDEAFKKTGQSSAADMLPSELADRYIAEMRATDEYGLPSLEVLANRPVLIDGRIGFALHVRFLSDDGLRYERLTQGFADDNGLYLLDYQAPSLHFFERDRATFDKLVGSFRVI